MPAACLLLFALCPLHARAAAWTKQQSGTLAWLHAVFFTDTERGWAVGGKGALLSTPDGGVHWRARRSPTEDTLRDIFFTDERTGWIVCERSIYQLQTKDEPRSYLLRTTDGGDSWARVEVTGADVDAVLVRLLFTDREHGYTLGEAGALYATTDGGATWSRRRVPTRRLLLGATFLDAQRGWL
ncbi:MAG: YCF48-related protein, partial [Pyrinomonadaceae bacterium]